MWYMQGTFGAPAGVEGIRSITLKSEFKEGKQALGPWWIVNYYLYIRWLGELGSSWVELR
jgi:hypothetical protein